MISNAIFVFVVLVCVGAVIGIMFRLLITSKDTIATLVRENYERRILRLEQSRKSYEEIAADAVASALEMTNSYRLKEGKAPLAALQPVVSESHSPPTSEQMETARIATMRAQMVEIRREAGQSPRTRDDSSPDI